MGDTSNAPSGLGARIIKANHAGERGAVCIYNGQILLVRFTARDIVPTLVEFREHGRGHRAIFQQSSLVGADRAVEATTCALPAAPFLGYATVTSKCALQQTESPQVLARVRFLNLIGRRPR